jgi:hypothetical protein
MRYSMETAGEALHNPLQTMTNAQKTYGFLRSADDRVRDQIIGNITSHYGISRSEAFDEVTDPDAEHLLDYLTEPVRSATRVLMQRAGIA